jgi:hypothetical protein
MHHFCVVCVASGPFDSGLGDLIYRGSHCFNALMKMLRSRQAGLFAGSMVLAGTGALLPGSVQAANYCSFGTNSLFAACTTSTTFVVGGMTLSNLKFSGATGDGFFSWLEQSPGSGIFQAKTIFEPVFVGPGGPGYIDYDLSVIPSSGKFFLDAGLTSQGPSQPVAPLYTVIKAASDSPAILELTVDQDNTYVDAPFDSITLQSIHVQDTFNVEQGSLESFINTFRLQDRAPGDPVPGPLPLLGAGAAFGFSRRLRSRLLAAKRV